MIYLSSSDIDRLGIDWKKTCDVIVDCVKTCSTGAYAQPLKPYLRYGNPSNRIIAMPAYIGDPFNIAGLKWIASFPDNVRLGKKRANSVVVINDAATGEVLALVNGSGFSAIRTASVSGAVLREHQAATPKSRLVVGVIGLGPIGRHHLAMCRAICGPGTIDFVAHDLNDAIADQLRDEADVTVVGTWREAYCASDVVITCTVADRRYINAPPKAGALLLNVSLRDYTNDVFPSVAKSIFVDDWNEVCRENTDIEQFHLGCGLRQEDTRSLADIILRRALKQCDAAAPIMFNPMGMAVFDLAIAHYYLDEARKRDVGMILPGA